MLYNFFLMKTDRKGVIQMKIRNNDELKLFEETLDR